MKKAVAATRLYWLIMASVLAGITIYQMNYITGMVMYPDEFGYWANAAAWLGFEWYDTVSIQSFYSFGYSLLLLPLLKAISNPFILYKAAILLNVFFVYIHAMLLWKIASKIGGKITERSRILYCLMAACYPSLIFYMQLTLTESLLNLLYLLSIWVLLCYEDKGKYRYAVLFVLIIAYSYFVHMRTLGIMAAGFAVLYVCFHRKNKEWNRRALFFLGLIVIFVFIYIMGDIIKEFLQTGIYHAADEEVMNTNDYEGQIGKIKYILTGQGFIDFMISCLGKLFYLGIATLGSIYFGAWYLLKKCRKNPVMLFVLLSGIFTLLISSVYTIYGGRSDTYVYGRYNETVVPFFVYLGLCEMTENKYIFPIAAVAGVVQGAVAFLLSYTIRETNPVAYQGYFTIGMSGYFPREILERAEHYILYPAILGTLTMFLLVVVLGFFVRRKKLLVLYLLLFILFYIYTGISAGGKYVYDHSVDSGEDMVMAGAVKRRLSAEDEVVFYMSDSDAQYVDILQFCLREHPLRIVGDRMKADGEMNADYVITYRSNPQNKELGKKYRQMLSTYHFNFYYDR